MPTVPLGASGFSSRPVQSAARRTMLFGLATTLASLPGAAQDKSEIKLEVVKYDGLKDAVVRHRGKVLLIDFWGEY